MEASRLRYVRGLHSTGFITDSQCDRSQRLFYVGTVGQIPLGETALHSLRRIRFNPLTLGLLHRTATFASIRNTQTIFESQHVAMDILIPCTSLDRQSKTIPSGIADGCNLTVVVLCLQSSNQS